SLLLALIAFASILFSVRAQASEDRLAVGVMTRLDRQKLIWDGVHSRKIENAPEHGKIYSILLIQPVDSLRKLVKPVNAAEIRDELVKQLEKNGFHRVKPGQKPEIVLWVI